MPTHTQTIVESVASVKDMGSSSSATAQACFPASPMYSGDVSDDERKAAFEELVLSAEVNDGGHTFGTFNRDFVDAPDLNEVETGGGGLPASPYCPNPVSPGEGSLNATDVGEPPEGFGQTPSATWGSGVGSQLQPSESSAVQSHGTLGDFIMGKAWGTNS